MTTILHLGLGSFHRAHQALYIHELRQRGDTEWSITGGNLRPDMLATMEALQAQGGAYTLETVTPQGERSYTRIESIQKVIPYQDDLAPLIAAGAEAATRIISFTVTEAGYYLDAKNQLDWATFADLRADLEAVKAGRAGHTIYGGLVSILRARMHSGAGAVTLMNCDNLRHNGERSRAGLLQFIDALGDAALKAWVEQNTSSPNAMVDRITPRPTPDVAERVKAATGWDDKAAIMGESFIQWVIEDNFIAGRPPGSRWAWRWCSRWTPMKKPRSACSMPPTAASPGPAPWWATSTSTKARTTAAIRRMAYDYVTDDTIPVLDTPEKPSPLDLRAYRDVVLDRFGNPAICDTNQRVAMDGYSKIPGFIVPTIRERLGARRVDCRV